MSHLGNGSVPSSDPQYKQRQAQKEMPKCASTKIIRTTSWKRQALKKAQSSPDVTDTGLTDIQSLGANHGHHLALPSVHWQYHHKQDKGS